MSEQVTYRRAKGWQLALAVMSQVVPTALVILMTFASYVATGVYGAATILAGGIITGTRIFDAITDPICGFLTDKLNTKFWFSTMQKNAEEDYEEHRRRYGGRCYHQ